VERPYNSAASADFQACHLGAVSRVGQEPLHSFPSIEFEKEKMAIAVPSLDRLPSVTDTLISAIRAGELDVQLAQASTLKATKNKTA
jgi:hypothetical protein